MLILPGWLQLESAAADIDIERETYNTNREGLTQVLDATTQQVGPETEVGDWRLRVETGD